MPPPAEHDASDVVTMVLTRAAVGLLEVAVAHVLWRLWNSYARSQRATPWQASARPAIPRQLPRGS
jgi:hypothetical protein